MGDGFDLRATGEEGGHLERVPRVALHAERQRLDTEHEQEGIERRHAGAEIAQRLGPQLHEESVLAERRRERQPVVRGGRLGDLRELPLPPGEPPGLHHDPADARPVSAKEFRRGVDHDVRAPLQRPAEERRGEGAVHHEGGAVLVADRRDALDVQDVAAGVADGLPEEQPGLSPHRAPPGVLVVGIHEGDAEAQFALQVADLGEGAAVERPRRDEVIAGAQDGEERRRLRREARSEGHRPDAALEARNPFLEGGNRGVDDPGIGVPVLLEVEVGGGRLRILENVAGGLEDGDGPGSGVRLRAGPGVDGAGSESEVPGLAALRVVAHRTDFPARRERKRRISGVIRPASSRNESWP